VATLEKYEDWKMPAFIPTNPNYQAEGRAIFTAQTTMHTLGATLAHIAPAEADIVLPFRDDLLQQDGFIHAGILTTVVDTACGLAAFTLMPPNSRVLTIEYKVNFMSPAIGEQFICQGRVVRAGRTITVCRGDVLATNDGNEKLVATMTATMISIT
jgi:uncharacterized protein (TIGR00369 family)